MQNLVTKNKTKESACGLGGSVLAGPFVFSAVWNIIDVTGRVQTTIALTPHLAIFATPTALVLELIGAVGFLFYATRLEHAREAEAAPRIILPPYAKPSKPRRHWFWLKVALAVALIAFVAAVGTEIRLRSVVVPATGPQTASLALPITPQPHPTDQRTQTIVPANKAGAHAAASTRTSAATKTGPVNLNPAPSDPLKKSEHGITMPSAVEPESLVTVPNMVSEGTKPIALVGGKIVDAIEKPPGVTYLVVLVSDVTQYRGSPNIATIRKVVAVLEKLPDVRVFFSADGYKLNRGGVISSFGGGGGGVSATATSGDVLFFNAQSERLARQVQEALRGIVDIKAVRRGSPARGSDAGALLYKDFFSASGIDIEVVL